MLKRALGKTIQELRKSAGITQTELGERANLHRTYISEVETGTRNLSLETIANLAAALECPLPKLFSRMQHALTHMAEDPGEEVMASFKGQRVEV